MHEGTGTRARARALSLSLSLSFARSLTRSLSDVHDGGSGGSRSDNKRQDSTTNVHHQNGEETENQIDDAKRHLHHKSIRTRAGFPNTLGRAKVKTSTTPCRTGVLRALMRTCVICRHLFGWGRAGATNAATGGYWVCVSCVRVSAASRSLGTIDRTRPRARPRHRGGGKTCQTGGSQASSRLAPSNIS